uniref:Uncharacterized protein n=1 Tax=Knipowitschia caucasica TaxID=637954 RepID=A0AAV2KPN9_KNICA
MDIFGRIAPLYLAPVNIERVIEKLRRTRRSGLCQVKPGTGPASAPARDVSIREEHYKSPQTVTCDGIKSVLLWPSCFPDSPTRPRPRHRPSGPAPRTTINLPESVGVSAAPFLGPRTEGALQDVAFWLRIRGRRAYLWSGADARLTGALRGE